MKNTRYSKQREAIKEYICSSKEHPTAETIYHSMLNQFPNISLGTVYRNLNVLVGQGKILSLNIGDGTEHYDGNLTPHHHFHCRICHRVMDLNMDPINHIDYIAGAGFDGTIEGHVIYFQGICPNCKAHPPAKPNPPQQATEHGLISS